MCGSLSAEVNLLSQGCFKTRLQFCTLQFQSGSTICLFESAVTHSITPKASHHILCCWNWVIYGKYKCHHEYPDLKGTHKDPWVQLLHRTTLRITPACLYNKSSPHTLAQGSTAQISVTASPQHRELLQSITASQLPANPMLTAECVHTTWLIWHKSPMMLQASSTNWFDKSQPRKFFLHVTVKTTRIFCDTAHRHGAVYVLLIWFAR